MLEKLIFKYLHKLITKYKEQNTFKFDIFTKLWLDGGYNKLYAAQNSQTDIVKTTHAVLHFSRLVISDDECNFSRNIQLERVGALYIMYIIYKLGEINEHIKIEWSLKSWQFFQVFIEKIALIPETDDARLIYWILINNHKIDFACKDFEVDLDSSVNYDKIYYETFNKKPTATESFQDNDDVLKIMSSLKEMDKLDKKYAKELGVEVKCSFGQIESIFNKVDESVDHTLEDHSEKIIIFKAKEEHLQEVANCKENNKCETKIANTQKSPEKLTVENLEMPQHKLKQLKTDPNLKLRFVFRSTKSGNDTKNAKTETENAKKETKNAKKETKNAKKETKVKPLFLPPKKDKRDNSKPINFKRQTTYSALHEEFNYDADALLTDLYDKKKSSKI